MCKFDNQHIVEELKSKLGFGWHVYPVNIYQKSNKDFKSQLNYAGPIFCVHCRAVNISQVHSDAYGTLSGGAKEWVFKCNDCLKYMSVEHEWG